MYIRHYFHCAHNTERRGNECFCWKSTSYSTNRSADEKTCECKKKNKRVTCRGHALIFLRVWYLFWPMLSKLKGERMTSYAYRREETLIFETVNKKDLMMLVGKNPNEEWELGGERNRTLRFPCYAIFDLFAPEDNPLHFYAVVLWTLLQNIQIEIISHDYS